MNPLVPLTDRAATRPDAQRGAVLVLAVVLLTVLIGVAAVAVDLAGLRQDRRSHRAAADFAALAASGALVGDPADACQRAWSTVRSNLMEDTGSASWSPGCSTFTTAPCDPATPRQAMATVGRYEVAITHPVPDGHPLMTGTGGTTQAIEATIDGTACERMAVRIRSNRTYFFGRIFGINSGTTAVHAVGRASELPPQPGEAVALLLLDPSRCNVLVASGNGIAIIDESLPQPDGERAPGNIHLDSDGTGCPNNAYTVDANGTNPRILALPSSTSGLPGRIALRALPAGATTCTNKACDPADVNANPARLNPQPIPTQTRIGRRVVEHRYNCKSTYTFPNQTWWNGTVPPCTTGGSNHIDQLQARYQSSLPGDEVWMTYSGSCNPNSDQLLTGNWFIGCSNLSVSRNFTITGSAVFAGDVSVQSNGELAIGDGTAPRVAYFRNGSFSKTGQATVVLPQVSVYLRNGGIGFAGQGGLTWSGPASGPLEGLALWSESHTHSHSLSGGAVNDVYGVFYAPNAGYASNNVFSLSGGGNQTQFRAQFITYRLEISGNGELIMQAPPIITLPQPSRYESRLIR
jgi:hypothetical protein